MHTSPGPPARNPRRWVVLAYTALSVAVMLLVLGRGSGIAVLAAIILARGGLILIAKWSQARGNRFAGVIAGAWVGTSMAVLVLGLAVMLRALSR